MDAQQSDGFSEQYLNGDLPMPHGDVQSGGKNTFGKLDRECKYPVLRDMHHRYRSCHSVLILHEDDHQSGDNEMILLIGGSA